jgi:hypothetical protein
MRTKGKQNLIHEKLFLIIVGFRVVKAQLALLNAKDQTQVISKDLRTNWVFLMLRTKPNSQIGNEGCRKIYVLAPNIN